MTETLPAVLTTPSDEAGPLTIGRATPGCRVLVAWPGTTEPVEPGEEGELLVGGRPGRELFSGYLDDPATTAAAWRDAWFVTGDHVRRDEDGSHRFAGRRSDVLKVAGENVSTVEVEAVVAAHPAVVEVTVVGAPDPVRDEVPVAHVVAPAADAAALEQWCAERLAPSKRPRSFVFHDELPRTSVGKIRKFQLDVPRRGSALSAPAGSRPAGGTATTRDGRRSWPCASPWRPSPG